MLYGVLSFASAALGVIQSVVFAKILGPEGLGYYTIVLTIASYASLAQLGILSGLNRELPVALGAGKGEKAQALIGQVKTALLTIVGGGLLVFAVVMGNLHLTHESLQQAVLLGGVVGASNMFFQIAILRLRSELKTTLFSGVLLLQKVLTLAGGSVAAYYAGFVGLVLVLIGTNVLLYWQVSQRYLAPAPCRKVKLIELGALMKVGIPIMGAGVLTDVQLRMDRLFLIGVSTPNELGLYQFGALPITLGFVLHGVVSQYLTPKLLFKFGVDGKIGSVFKRSLGVSVVVTGVLLAACPLVMPIARWGVEHWMPEYSKSVSIMAIFYFGTALVAGNVFGVTMLAAKKQMLDLAAVAFSTAVSLAGFIIVANMHLPLRWFASVAVMGIAMNYIARLGIAWYCVTTGQESTDLARKRSLGVRPAILSCALAEDFIHRIKSLIRG